MLRIHSGLWKPRMQRDVSAIFIFSQRFALLASASAPFFNEIRSDPVPHGTMPITSVYYIKTDFPVDIFHRPLCTKQKPCAQGFPTVFFYSQMYLLTRSTCSMRVDTYPISLSPHAGMVMIFFLLFMFLLYHNLKNSVRKLTSLYA